MKEDDSPLISIIIPVYNAENYLNQCFGSIRVQTYQNLEIIFIDDGSTDHSYGMCLAYAVQDLRVRVYTKKNGGQSSARRLGVEKAAGTYIGFVDADDWIDSTMYEKMFRIIQKYSSDIVICEFHKAYADGTVISQASDMTGMYDGKYLISHFFLQEDCFCGRIPGTLYTALFCKDKIRESISLIDDRINYSEDFAWLAAACLNSPKVYVMRESLYFYRVNENSVTNVHNKSNIESQKLLFQNMANLYREKGLSKEAYRQLGYMVIRDMMMGGYDYFLDKYEELFPYSGVHKNLKIVIYGAGQCGTEMYSKIKTQGSRDIEAWVDRNWSMYDSEQVLPVESIKNVKFDYIVMAVLKQSVSRQIKRDLIGMGIDEHKIALMDMDFINREADSWSGSFLRNEYKE